MSVGASGRSEPEREADLTRTYVLVLVVEAVAILALYWLGRTFS